MGVESVGFLVFYSAVFLGGAGTIFYLGFKNISLARTVKRTPTSQVVDVRKGFVELKGKVESVLGRYLQSPVRKVPCVYYHTKVQRYVSGGKGGHWQTVWKSERGVKFLLRDGSGKISVEPMKARMVVKTRQMNTTGIFSSPPGYLLEFLRSEGIDARTLFGNYRRFRYIERYLPLKKEIYVLGTAVDVPLDPELERDLEVIPFTISSISRKVPFVITDSSERDFLITLVMKGIGWFILSIIVLGIGYFLLTRPFAGLFL
ncbi:MAG: GIDE domain-containing protein [Thermoplasmatota archaeon]